MNKKRAQFTLIDYIVLVFSVMILSAIFGYAFSSYVLCLSIGAIVSIILALIFYFYGKRIRKQIQKEIDYYLLCEEKGISELDTEENEMTAMNIALEQGFAFENFKKFFMNCKRLSAKNGFGVYETKKERELFELKERQKEKAESLILFSKKVGTEKRISMLTERKNLYLKNAKEAKEQALAFENKIEEKRLNFESQLDDNEDFDPEYGMDALQKKEYKIHAFEERAEIIQPKIEEAKNKKVEYSSEKELFDNLEFYDTGIFPTKSEAVWLKSGVVLKEDIKENWVLDGSVKAEILKDGVLVGETVLPFPIYGISKEGRIKGICLEGISPDEEYEFNFSPVHLWLMEQ